MKLPATTVDVCHRCDQAPATGDGILCSACRLKINDLESCPCSTCALLRRAQDELGVELEPAS